MIEPNRLEIVADDAASALARARSPVLQEPLNALRKTTNEAARAWSGSNLGYHAIVYYYGIQPAPPGAQFSPEWGLMGRWGTHQADPGWQEMDYQSVVDEIVRRANAPDIEAMNRELASVQETFLNLKERAISLLSVQRNQNADPFLVRKYEQIESLEVAAPQDIERALIAKGAGWSRDSTAVTQGYRLAPHQSLLAIVLSADNIANALDKLEKATRETVFHLQQEIGHGGETIQHAPASDRIVTLDHNSPTYIQTTEELDRLVEALEQVNDYPDGEDKEQKLAELSAGRSLLRAAKVRYGLIVGALGPPLAWLGKTFAGGIIGQLATAVWQGLKVLIGL